MVCERDFAGNEFVMRLFLTSSFITFAQCLQILEFPPKFTLPIWQEICRNCARVSALLFLSNKLPTSVLVLVKLTEFGGLCNMTRRFYDFNFPCTLQLLNFVYLLQVTVSP